MFGFIFACWQKIKNKYKKFLPFIFTFIFFFSPLSVSAADFEQPTFAVEIHNYENNPSPIQYGSGAVLLKTNVSSRPVLEFDCIIPFGLIQNSSDYLVFNFVCHSSIQNVSPVPTMYLESNLINRYGTSSAVIYNSSSTLFEGSYGFSFTTRVSQFDNFDKTQLARIRVKLTWPEGESRFETCLFTMSAMISSVDGSYSEIVGAINNQTDYIVNGDSSTGGIVSGADSSRNELESIVSDYQEIENSMLDNFTLYQSDILTDLNGWSWGGLSVCANWVGDTMTSYFQNMGDFKQYIIYPLLLGIALFFIGRGSAIIGHLYRKPTNVHTDTVVTRTTVKNGNTSNTVSHTDTYRSGGVLRK